MAIIQAGALLRGKALFNRKRQLTMSGYGTADTMYSVDRKRDVRPDKSEGKVGHTRQCAN